MLPSYVRNYVIAALQGAPDVLETLLAGLAPDDSGWDRRPDPDRFTLREIVAHLADWEPIFLDRMARTRTEHEPVLEGYDEVQLAIDRDYAHSDPVESLRRFREGRAQMVAFLETLTPDEWERAGNRPEVGLLSLETQCVLVAGHDGYHNHQVVQWRSPDRH